MFNKKYLLNLLSDNNEVSFKNLAKKMNVPIRKNKEFSTFLFSVVKTKEIFISNKREFYIPKFIGEFEGVIKISPKGFGFVDIDKEKSIFILKENSSKAFDGDVVRVKYFMDPIKKGSFQGIVNNVVERNLTKFVGRVKRFGNQFGLIPFNKKINSRFRFESEDELLENMEVKVQVVRFEEKYTIIKVIKKLGMFDDASMDIILSIEDAGVATEFHHETLREANHIKDNVSKEERENRIDLRNELIYTIDGDDTKDFDDAISIKKLDNGNYSLGVHIADVTHYVKEDSPLDKESNSRGVSIYLADRVIPMLPEKLSNGICSLNPNVDRLTISCEMEIDSVGNNVSSKIFPSVINSKYRLTYKEVNNFHKGKDIWNDAKLSKSLNLNFELSNIIRKFKNNEGYIDFEIEEAKIIIDDNGRTLDIVPRERSYSEILIEDFMVRANETIAKYVSDMKLAFIYRVHDKPTSEKIVALQNIMKLLNIDAHIRAQPTSIDFSKSVEKIKKSRFDDFMKIVMLRTMAKAEYSPNNIGHFGLASKFYTHFTSPIRRYPDLMVHRMLREYIFNDEKNLSKHFEQILPEISENSSIKEQKAIMLERKVADIKKAEFYEQFIGKKFIGTIISILNFGFFVEFPNKVNGLVHISTLNDGDYSLDKTGYVLSNGKRTLTIGDEVEVYVSSVDKIDAKIDLILSDIYEKNTKLLKWKMQK